MKLELHRHRNLLTGFFVISALVTFAILIIVLFEKKGVFELQYKLSAVFENGVGLRPGADVLFNGVKIGRVQSLNLMGTHDRETAAGKVVLDLTIDKKFQDFITSKSRAFALRDKNLVSDRVVNIETDGLGGRVLLDDDTIEVSDSRDIESVISGLTKLMGKMDLLINSIDSIATMSKDSNSTVGAMLGSRKLYDRILESVNHVDIAVGQGRDVLGRVQGLTDTLHSSLGDFLSRADTTSLRLVRTADQVEKLSVHANVLADESETILRRMDQIMLQGAGKLDQAGDLMDAVSQIWFIRGKISKNAEYPVLLNEIGP
jgi:phospholipid/cholesterol/gamma-HCH transport system substrate-binding protein